MPAFTFLFEHVNNIVLAVKEMLVAVTAVQAAVLCLFSPGPPAAAAEVVIAILYQLF